MLALRIGIDHVHRRTCSCSARHCRSQLDVESLFLEMPLGLLRDRSVRYRQELFHRLEHRDLAAEPPPNAAEFEANDAGADDAETRGNGIELQGIPRIDDIFSVMRYVLEREVK